MTPKSAEERARSLGLRMARMAVETMGRRLEEGDFLGALEARATASAGLDVMTRQAVAGAADTGASWRDMGTSLGVSKQAAHARWATSREQLLIDQADELELALDHLVDEAR